MKYLGSGLIKGVGPSTARLIVATFGKDTLEIMGTQPERLTEVPKIGKVRMKRIAESFLEQQASRSTYIFLQQYGVSPALAAKIHKAYREQAESLIRDNPYRLIDDIHGVGFLTADRIALSLGISEDSVFRLQAGIKYALSEASGSGGHTCLPEEELIEKAAALLNAPRAEIRRLMDDLTLNKHLFADVIDDTRFISLPGLRKAEMDVASRLLALCGTSQQFFPQHIKAAITDFERSHGIRFSKTQRQAVSTAAEHGFTVITGGPGTGKTTLINCIIHVLGKGSKIRCRPRNRAASA